MTNSKLTKAQKQLIDSLNDGFTLQVVGVTGKYRCAVLSPPDSDLDKKDFRRKAVNAQTVNKLFTLGLLEEKIYESGVNPCQFADLVF